MDNFTIEKKKPKDNGIICWMCWKKITTDLEFYPLRRHPSGMKAK